jgi:nucleoside-diphosphate-sugar epimerase
MENLSHKKILITGNEGYIGRRLEEKLDKLGIAHVGCDLHSLEPMDVRYITELPQVDAIVHLAAISHEPTAQSDPKETDEINHKATERLAMLARRAGIRRFIFSSSCSVYFTFDTPLEPAPYKESDTVNPVSAYSLSKRAAEQSLLKLAHLHSFEPVIFRFGTVYGASPNMRTDTVVHHMIGDAKRKGKIFVGSGGKIWRPLADIEDVTWAIIKAIDLPGIGGEIFNVATGNWNINDLAETIKKTLQLTAEIEVQPFGLTRNYLADTTKFKEKFGWSPQRTFEEAIKELYQIL